MNEAFLTRPAYALAAERFLKLGCEICVLVPPSVPHRGTIFSGSLDKVDQAVEFNIGIRSKGVLAIRAEADLFVNRVPLHEIAAYRFVRQFEGLRLETPCVAHFLFRIDSRRTTVSEHYGREEVGAGPLGGTKLIAESGVCVHGTVCDIDGRLARIACEGELSDAKRFPSLMEALGLTGRLDVDTSQWLVT